MVPLVERVETAIPDKTCSQLLSFFVAGRQLCCPCQVRMKMICDLTMGSKSGISGIYAGHASTYHENDGPTSTAS